MGNFHSAPGDKTNNQASLHASNHSWSTYIFIKGILFPDSLSLQLEHTEPYSYGYHLPLDVSMTYWSSRNVPTLPLLHTESTISLTILPYSHKVI
jgi:hypothetical protein